LPQWLPQSQLQWLQSSCCPSDREEPNHLNRTRRPSAPAHAMRSDPVKCATAARCSSAKTMPPRSCTAIAASARRGATLKLRPAAIRSALMAISCRMPRSLQNAPVLVLLFSPQFNQRRRSHYPGKRRLEGPGTIDNSGAACAPCRGDRTHCSQP
jgi:hypothetical protein